MTIDPAAEKAAKKAAKAEKKAAKAVKRQERSEKWAKMRAESNFHAMLGNYRLKGDRIGSAFTKMLPIAGATAEFDSGGDAKRMTATRVVTGGVLFGPAGAVVGGMAKKNKGKCYVTVYLATGDTIMIEESHRKESEAREFVAKVNAAGRYYANQT